MSDTVAVVVMAYGSPASPEDIEEYYTHIRRGRPPAPEQLAELVSRYEAIGGVSTLRARTAAQAAAIAAALEDRQPGRFEVVVGMKHAEPFIEDAVAEVAAAGLRRAVGVVLAPHYSGASVGQYHERAAQAATEHGVRFDRIDRWWDEPAYLDFLAAGIRTARRDLPDDHKVLFTAHSLPVRVLEGDPYESELEASAEAVAERLDLHPFAHWGRCWQSAGRSPEPWAGPDILDIITTLAETGRTSGVLVCPQGFVADHLEVAYDLDIEARDHARSLGLAFARSPVANDDPAVMAALAERIERCASTP